MTRVYGCEDLSCKSLWVRKKILRKFVDVRKEILEEIVCVRKTNFTRVPRLKKDNDVCGINCLKSTMTKKNSIKNRYQNINGDSDDKDVDEDKHNEDEDQQMIITKNLIETDDSVD